MAVPHSDDQVSLNRQLHQSDPAFGINSVGLSSRIPLAINRLSQHASISTVLDYGTGKGFLVDQLRSELPNSIKVDGYDPSVDKWSSKPDTKYDILTCIDVLEHIDIYKIDTILRDIRDLTRLFCYISIDLQPAVKTLNDGRNAHVMLAPSEWWITRISQLFPCLVSFPIKHLNSTNQKIIIACSHDANALPLIYYFLNKVNIYSSIMKGGLHGGNTIAV